MMSLSKFRRLFTSAAALGAACIFSSCGTGPVSDSSGSGLAVYNAYDRPASLPTNRSAVRVKVSLRNQMVYVMEGNKPLLIMPVSIGKPSKPTPTGNFRIQEKDHYYRANTHGYAINGNVIRGTYLRNKPAGWGFKGTPMPYWCGFKTGYGFHTGWMKPYPTSAGCLRMHQNVAPKFFRIVSVGTPVNIAHSQPEDATIGRNIPRPPDATPLPSYPAHMMANTQQYFTLHKKPTFVR